MDSVFARVKKYLFQQEEAASIGEYAVALMLIAIVTLAAVTFLGNAISSFFVSASTTI